MNEQRNTSPQQVDHKFKNSVSTVKGLVYLMKTVIELIESKDFETLRDVISHFAQNYKDIGVLNAFILDTGHLINHPVLRPALCQLAVAYYVAKWDKSPYQVPNQLIAYNNDHVVRVKAGQPLNDECFVGQTVFNRHVNCSRTIVLNDFEKADAMPITEKIYNNIVSRYS